MDGPWIAIVGTRRSSLYGLGLRAAGGAAKLGCCIVSVWRGVDTAGLQRELWMLGGRPWLCWLRSGSDIPPENFDLYQRLLARGAVLGEFHLVGGRIGKASRCATVLQACARQ